MGKNLYDIVGKKFGRYLVLERDLTLAKNYSRWKCLCDCGVIKTVMGRALINGEIKSCGCWQKEKDHTNFHGWQGYEEISGNYWSSIKRAALKRKIEFSVTIEEAWEQYKKQIGKCALTGDEISFVRDYSRNCQTASLDRINSQAGYTRENIQWIHKDINKFKRDFDEKTLIEWCFKVLLHKKHQ